MGLFPQVRGMNIKNAETFSGEQSHYQNHRFRGDDRHGDVAMNVRSRIRPVVPATSTQEKHLNHTAAGIGKNPSKMIITLGHFMNKFENKHDNGTRYDKVPK